RTIAGSPTTPATASAPRSPAPSTTSSTGRPPRIRRPRRRPITAPELCSPGWHAHVRVGMGSRRRALAAMPTSAWACHPTAFAGRQTSSHQHLGQRLGLPLAVDARQRRVALDEELVTPEDPVLVDDLDVRHPRDRSADRQQVVVVARLLELAA